MTNVKPVLTVSLVLLLGMDLAADARAQAGAGDDRLPVCVEAAKWSSDPIPGADLWSAGGPGGAYVAVKTNAGNVALLSVSALDTLVIESAQLFNPAGKEISKKEYLRVPAGSTFDLDTGTASSDSTADLKWNSGAGGKSLEPLNKAMVYACRPSDRRVAGR
jgi:hypothetical protein